MMNKIHSVMVIGFLLAITPVLQAGDFTYQTSGGEVTITGYIGPGGDVVIPDMIEGFPVTSIGEWAFSNCTSLTSVTIGNFVTSIGDGAFECCINLISIAVDSANPSYSSQDGVLFNKDQTLLVAYPGGKSGSYIIPDSVASIGYSAFGGCTSLTSVTIPDSVTSISDLAFYSCFSLTSVTIPNSVISIGKYAFMGCDSLINVAIPDSVISIGEGAFSGCASLINVAIPDSVTSIGHSSFSHCASLTSVTIGNGVTSIGGWAFALCYSLNSITVDSTNPSYSSQDGVLFNKDQTLLVAYPEGKSGSYIIPDSVASIA